MKFSTNDYQELKSGVVKAVEFIQITKQIPNVHKYYLEQMKVSETRFRWDMMWSAMDNGFCDRKVLKPYNDSHIDTALKQIIKEIS